MRNFLVASAILIASATCAVAADDLSTKIMKDNPGTTQPGTTDMPNAKPDDSSVSQKQMKDAPGVQSKTGATADPTAKPTDSSISEKEMKDAPGTK